MVLVPCTYTYTLGIVVAEKLSPPSTQKMVALVAIESVYTKSAVWSCILTRELLADC